MFPNSDFIGEYKPPLINGVPVEYTKQTANGDSFLIQKGQLNSLRLRPQIMNEHAESSRNVQGTVISGNIVGQVFKASQDNINSINLTLESAAGTDFDDFESYADSTALQVEWVSSGVIDAELDTTNPHTGDKCMFLDMGVGTAVGTQWVRTFPTVDFTGYTGQIWMYATREYKDVKLIVLVEDSVGNQSKADIITAGISQYFEYNFNINSLIGTADITDIVKIGFEADSVKNLGEMYIDDMVSIPGPGQVEVKLWNMGTDIPVSTVTALTDGTQYTKLGDLGITGLQASSVIIDLLGGKRMYHLNNFVAGVALEIPGNEILVPDNYYAITIHYVDTDVSVYGPNEAWNNYYENGFGFTTDLEANPITAMGTDIDIQFIIFSTQKVYVYEITVVASGTPNGESLTTVYVEDENMKRTDVLVSGIQAVPAITTRLIAPFFMDKGAKIEQEYNDDFTDDVTSINLIFQYLFIPPEVNG